MSFFKHLKNYYPILENIVNLKEVLREYQLQDINGDSLFVRLES